MANDAFIFSKWEQRFPYYALKGWDEDKIVAAEKTWATVRSKGIRTCLLVTFGAGWRSVIKEAGKQTLRYGSRKALGFVTSVVCGYFCSVSVCVITNSTKIVKAAKCCHSICSGGLDFAELCAACPMHVVEIAIFGRPAVLDNSQGFDMFSSEDDPVAGLIDVISKSDK